MNDVIHWTFQQFTTVAAQPFKGPVKFRNYFVPSAI